MSNKIDARISIKTDGTGKVISDVQKVTDTVKQSTSSVDALKKKLSSINVATKIAAVAAGMHIVGSVVRGIGNAIGSVVNAVDGFATNADTIAKFSRNVGLSSVQLQQWRYAAERSGMSTENFDKSLRKFSVNVSKAAGGEKKQLDLFNALGVSLRKQNGELKSNNQLMLEVADAYKKIGNAQDRLRVSEELFGKGGTGFGTMFEGGSAGIQELLNRRARIGGMITEEDAQNAEKFKDLLLDVDKVKEAIENRAMTKLMPSLSNSFEQFLDWWDVNGEHALDNVKIAVDVVTYSVQDVVSWVGQAVDVFGNMGDVVKGLGITFSEWANGWGDALYNAVIAPIVTFFGTTIPNMASTAKCFVLGVWDGVSNAVLGVFNTIKAGIIGAIANVADTLSSLPFVGDKFAGLAQSMRAGIAEPQKQNQSGVQAAQTFTQNRNTTTTNRLEVSFAGMPNGTTVTPDKELDSSVFDISTGYIFGY